MDGIHNVGVDVKKHQGQGTSPVLSGSEKGGSAANAFSALMEAVSSRFSGTFGMPAMESKLVRSDDTAQARARDTRQTETARKKDEARDDDKPVAKTRDKEDDDSDESDTKATDKTASSEDESDAKGAQADTTHADAQVSEAIAAEFPVVTDGENAVITANTQQVVATEGVNKEVVAPVVKTEGSEVKVAQAATQTAPVVKANSDGDLPQFRQFANTATQTQQTTDDAATKAQSAQVKGEVTAKSQDAGQKGPLDLRSAAAQDQSQSLSRTLASDNKIQVQVTTQGQQTAAAKSAEPGVYNIYSGFNQSGNTSLANGQVGVVDGTNALVQNSRSPAEQVQAQPAPASPAPAPQPQLQTSQQGTSSTQTALRADGAAPALSQSGQTNGGQMQNNAGFNLNAGQGTQANAEAARAAQTTATDRPHTTPQQIIDQIKVNITRASKAGQDRVTIQLRPEKLGRIEVKLEMSEEHKVRVTVTADTKETLQLLQTDSKGLERALNEAGLRTDANNLHFNLRGDTDSQKAGDERQSGQGDEAGKDKKAAKEEEALPDYDYSEAARSRGGVDTFA